MTFSSPFSVARDFPWARLIFTVRKSELLSCVSSSNELTEKLMRVLSQFVTHLIRRGELQLGKLLRRKSLERFTKSQPNSDPSAQDIVLIRNSISSKRATLLDFQPMDISEQLTLLDSELFLRIQLSEILYMSIEKGEDYSPNLAAFTEHFNNISYW